MTGTMNRRISLATGLGLLAGCNASSQSSFADDASLSGDAPGFALIELFTSQGCSSCPPADRNLLKLVEFARSQSLQIYALSFHVDYWNRLGWRDPFSKRLFTTRQREYAQSLRTSRIYTPQMIVNGVDEFVGSNSTRLQRALGTALRTKPPATIKLSVRREQRRPVLSWDAQGLGHSDSLNLALVRKSAGNAVPRGENRGSVLRHANIVEQFVVQRSPKPTGETPLQLPVDAPANAFQVIAFTQSRTNGRIRAAAAVELKQAS